MRVKKLVATCLAGALMVSALTGCGMDKNETVATLGEQEISLGVVNFMCRYQQASSDDMYRSFMGEDVWEQDIYGNGTSMGDSMKDQVLQDVHEMYTLKNHMDDYGVSLSSEDEKMIKDTATAFMEANSKEALEEMGATQEIVEEVLTLYTIQVKMHDAIVADADTEVSDEEANMRAYSIIEFTTASYYDSTLQTQVTYSEEQIERISQTATSAWEDLQENPDMKAVAEEYGYEMRTATYDADDAVLDKEVKTALDELSVNEISEVISTDNGFYIVRLDSETDEEATEQNRESIVVERQEALYTEVVAGWQEDDGWKVNDKVLKKIKFRNHLTQESGTESDTESVVEETTEATTEEVTVDGTEE